MLEQMEIKERQSMEKILIADDELRIRIMLKDFLNNSGYSVIEAADGIEAIKKFEENPDIKLIILDIMMPRCNGWDVCKHIKKVSQTPIIMLTAKNTDQDELYGFNSGTDEYMKKPFNPLILLARIEKIMERTYGISKRVQKGHYLIDSEKRTLFIDEQPIDLSQTEYKLLKYLISNESQALSREQLLNEIWGYEYDGSDRTVDTHMNRLRQKICKDYNYLHTVWGYGYKFEVTE